MQWLRCLPSSLLFLVVGFPCLAAQDGKVPPVPLICAPPVSTCATPEGGAGECPEGHVCRCVPSCPSCRDCAARVCVAAGEPQCRTACDCPPGLGCFEGRCIAGFAPVFCCDEGPCPSADQCQHRDGRMDVCPPVCVEQAWRCDTAGGSACGEGRECRCAASCPVCDDCPAGVCVPAGAAPPYRCQEGACAPGERCLCVPSCPDCADCALHICVPACGVKCEDRLRRMGERIDQLIDRVNVCQEDADCVAVDTSTQCRRSCSDTRIVHRRFQAKVQRLIGRLDHSLCSRYRGMGCPPVVTHCPQAGGGPLRGVCEAGRCKAVIGSTTH